jgi:hypothetical protein
MLGSASLHNYYLIYPQLYASGYILTIFTAVMHEVNMIHNKEYMSVLPYLFLANLHKQPDLCLI